MDQMWRLHKFLSLQSTDIERNHFDQNEQTKYTRLSFILFDLSQAFCLQNYYSYIRISSRIDRRFRMQYLDA